MAQVKVQDISTYLCSFLQYYGQGLHHLLKPHKFVSLNLRQRSFDAREFLKQSSEKR